MSEMFCRHAWLVILASLLPTKSLVTHVHQRWRMRNTALRLRATTGRFEASHLSEIAEFMAGRVSNELEMLSVLDEARSLAFFSRFSIDMLAGCSYIDEQPDECEMDSCEILPLEPVPEALYLRDSRERRFELDTWARMDMPSADYYDLTEYPEGFTGYNGSHVWRFVYEKLGFAAEARRVDHQSTSDSWNDPDGWRAVFDRIVSGVHASVSCHVADGMDDDDTCQTEFERRVMDHPERVANLHFAFALVLCAVAQAKTWLADYDFDVGNADEADQVKSLVGSLLAQDIFADPKLESAAALLRESAAAANECVLASSNDAQWLEETGIWQMRQRSRAMLRAFDCVQCGVCRLHGKVCWLGVATALKLIYTHDRNADKPLARIEVAALVVALEKLASSVRFCFEMSGDNPADTPLAPLSSA